MSDLNINGYQLSEPMSTKGAAFAKWGFGVKDGRNFFLKEFTDPVYPTADSPYSESTKQKIIANCLKYEADKRRFYDAINRASDGNLVRVEDFFRWGSRYYTVSRRVYPISVDVDSLGILDRVQICLTLSHALVGLHAANIIHADLKPSNIIYEGLSSDYITARVIDFDSSFFASDPPEEVVGDQVYLAPEVMVYMFDGPEAAELTCKLDVFSAGLVFHEILTGALPTFSQDYRYAFEAVLDGEPLRFSPKLPALLRPVLEGMLKPDYQERISMAQAFSMMQEVYRQLNGITSATEEPVKRTSRLQINFQKSAAPAAAPVEAPAAAPAPGPAAESAEAGPIFNFRTPGDL